MPLMAPLGILGANKHQEHIKFAMYSEVGPQFFYNKLKNVIVEYSGKVFGKNVVSMSEESVSNTMPKSLVIFLFL